MISTLEFDGANSNLSAEVRIEFEEIYRRYTAVANYDRRSFLI